MAPGIKIIILPVADILDDLEIFCIQQEKYPEAQPEQINAMIGGFFLLRFLNPAIVTPTGK